jgi:hypothetical protein
MKKAIILLICALAVSSKAQIVNVDSLQEVIARDSITVCNLEKTVFHGQEITRKKIDIGERLDCLDFLLRRHLRPLKTALQYLTVLSLFCTDKRDYFYQIRLIVDDEDKYKAVLSFKKWQSENSKVMAFYENLTREQ